MKKKSYKVFLHHILQECNFLIENSRTLNYEEFSNNPVFQRAFVRSLEIIGEAVKNLPAEFKDSYSHIPWKNIAGMRDILIHEYFGIDYELVWKVVKESIPSLRKEILHILSSTEDK